MSLVTDLAKLETDFSALPQAAESFMLVAQPVLSDLEAVAADLGVPISEVLNHPDVKLQLALKGKGMSGTRLQNLACFAIPIANIFLAMEGFPTVPLPAFCTTPNPVPASQDVVDVKATEPAKEIEGKYKPKFPTNEPGEHSQST